MIQITSFGILPLVLKIDNAERIIMANMEDAMERSVKRYQEVVRDNAGRFRFRGEFWDSISTEVTPKVRVIEGRVFSTDDPGKVLAIELSRRSSKAPPASALLDWVQQKWGGDLRDVFWLQRKIAERGSHNPPEGQRPFASAFESATPSVLSFWDAQEIFQDVLT